MGLKDLAYEPRKTTLRLILDDNIRIELGEAEAAARQGRDDPTLGTETAATQRLDEAKAAAESGAVTFIFQALPRPKLAELVAACPPTAAQLERWKEEDRNNPLIVVPSPEFDYEKFAPRLIAASMVEPASTEAEVVEMWEEGSWSDAVWGALWKAAWDRTNQQVSVLPTSGTGSGKTQDSGPKPPTQ